MIRPSFRLVEVGGQLHGTVKVERSVSVERRTAAVSTCPKVAMAVMASMLPRSLPRADPVRKIARTIAAMLPRSRVHRGRRRDRSASAVIDADTLDELVVRFARRLLRRRCAGKRQPAKHESRRDPIAAASSRQPRRARRRIGRGSTALDPAADATKPRSPNSNRHRGATLRRRLGEPACSTRPIPTSTSRRSTRSPAPLIRHLAVVEMHLIARMLDQNRTISTLTHTLNESLWSMLGHGAETASERGSHGETW